MDQKKSVQKVLEKSRFEQSPPPQSSGEFRFYLVGCLWTPACPQHKQCGCSLQSSLPSPPPKSASAQRHSPQHLSFPRFRSLLECMISGVPSTFPLLLSCTKSNSTFHFHQRSPMVKRQSLGFDFWPRNSAGLGPASPSWQLSRFPLVLPTAPWSLLLFLHIFLTSLSLTTWEGCPFQVDGKACTPPTSSPRVHTLCCPELPNSPSSLHPSVLPSVCLHRQPESSFYSVHLIIPLLHSDPPIDSAFTPGKTWSSLRTGPCGHPIPFRPHSWPSSSCCLICSRQVATSRHFSLLFLLAGMLFPRKNPGLLHFFFQISFPKSLQWSAFPAHYLTSLCDSIIFSFLPLLIFHLCTADYLFCLLQRKFIFVKWYYSNENIQSFRELVNYYFGSR